MSLTYDKIIFNINKLVLNSFNLNINNIELIGDSNLAISSKTIYGLIGENGIGKTTLLKAINNLVMSLDNSILKNYILYIEQEVILDERNIINYILDSNKKYLYYIEKLNHINNIINSDEFLNFNEDEINDLITTQTDINLLIESWNEGYEKHKIKNLLLKLGFSVDDYEKETRLFSGGWQMRISLARALYLEPNILLLDESSNFLDLEALISLIDYLNNIPSAVIVVSHNIGFLNDICDFILNIENKKLIQYKGNYNAFKKMYNNKILSQNKEWEKYTNTIKTMKHKGINKEKIQKYIENNHVNKPCKYSQPIIKFINPIQTEYNILCLDNISFGYNNTIILENISLGIGSNDRIVIVGKNGVGKSTLLKILAGELDPTYGSINIKCKIGYYSQDSILKLPLDLTPIEYLSHILPSNILPREQLGKIKIDAKFHNNKIETLSGGQKARLAIIELIHKNSQILLLDEITMHLDITTVDILLNALNNYTGSIIIVSHEIEFIKQLKTRILMIQEKKLIELNSYTDYCKIIL